MNYEHRRLQLSIGLSIYVGRDIFMKLFFLRGRKKKFQFSNLEVLNISSSQTNQNAPRVFRYLSMLEQSKTRQSNTATDSRAKNNNNKLIIPLFSPLITAVLFQSNGYNSTHSHYAGALHLTSDQISRFLFPFKHLIALDRIHRADSTWNISLGLSVGPTS